MRFFFGSDENAEGCRRLTAMVAVTTLLLPILFVGRAAAQTATPDQTTQSATPDSSSAAPSSAAPSSAAPSSAAPSSAAPSSSSNSSKKASKNVKKGEDPDQIGNRDVGKGTLKDPIFYSVEKEIGIGKQMAQEVERQAKIVDDPVIAEYVNRVGQNLVRNSDAKVPFTIKVIDQEEINAFALPGGFFFVNTGVITQADNEAELAGVMAHEIAHVAARHGMKQQTKGDLINYASIPAMILLGGWTGFAIRQGAQLAIPMGFLSFSRADEAQADDLGLQYMYKTGYDPNSFVDFFEKVQSTEKRKPGSMSKVFSSHPPTAERIKAAQKNIQDHLKERPEYVVNTSEFNDIKARVMAMHGRKAAPAANGSDPSKPTLRRNPNGTIDQNGQESDPKADSDDRPTLKRRDDQ